MPCSPTRRSLGLVILLAMSFAPVPAIGASPPPRVAGVSLLQPPYPMAALNGECGPQLYQLLSAQLDGDGNFDLIAVCEEKSSIFFGDGKGGFTRIEDLPFAGGTAIGDLDRDGDTDLVVGGTVLLGDGQGHFTVSQVLPGFGKFPGIPLTSIGKPTLGDFNSDGALDLVSSEGLLMLGSGGGTFGYSINLGIATVVGTGDFDADGNLDLVAFRFGDSHVGKLSLHLGTGSEIFEEYPLPLDQGLIIYADLVVGDLNGDSADDFVFANFEGEDSIVLGSPTRAFSDGASSFWDAFFESTSLLLADFDNDATLDLAWVNNNDGYIQYGNGKFGRFPTLLSPTDDYGWGPVAAGDFNGDGFVDIATAIGELFWVVPGTVHGFGIHVLPESADAHIVLQDLDLDGFDDAILFGREPERVTISLNHGDHTFSESMMDWGSTIHALDLADLNGDHLADLVVVDDLGVALALGVGRGRFAPPRHFPPVGLTGLRITTLEKGGDPSVIVFDEREICVLSALANGSLTSPLCTLLEEPSDLEATGDFDGDGHVDLALRRRHNDTYFILPGLGQGAFDAPRPTPIERCHQYCQNSLPLASGDFNGDGVDDLVLVEPSKATVYLGDPSGTLLARPWEYHDIYYPDTLRISDVDGDGTQDLVIHGLSGYIGERTGFIVMPGMGNGTFADATRFAAPDSTRYRTSQPLEEPFPSFVGGDLNGDSQTDLLFRHSDYGQGMWLFENRTPQQNHLPTARFDPLPQIECDSAAGGEVLLDASGSEDPDFASSNADEISLYAWYEDLGLQSMTFLGNGPTLSVMLGFGPHHLSLLVKDRYGKASTATADVNVVDGRPPVISVSLSPTILWPPDHRFVDIQARVPAEDACGPVDVVLESVTSSEPDDAPASGDGHTTGDIEATIGTTPFNFRLRAERSASGSGRVYTVTYRAQDQSGNTVRSSSTVMVPLTRTR